MRLFRTAVAVTLSTLASAVPTEPPDASTSAPAQVTLSPLAAVIATLPSPLAVAELDTALARRVANQTVQAVMTEEQLTRGLQPAQVDQEVAHIEAAVPNTTQNWASERKTLLHNEEDQMRQGVRDVVDAAQTAARNFKRSAKSLKKARKHAHVPKDVSNNEFHEDKELADHFQDEAKNYGDLAEDHITFFFDMAEDRLQQDIDHIQDGLRQQRQREEERAEEHDDDDDDDEDDEDDNADDDDKDDKDDKDEDDDDEDEDEESDGPKHEQRTNVDDDGDFGRRDGNQVDEPQTQDSAVGVLADASSSPLNLRAVGSTNTGDGPIVLVAFAGMGMIASFALVVQLRRRPARHAANEPLLGGN